MKKIIMLLLLLAISISLISIGFVAEATTVTKILGFDANDYSNEMLIDNTGYGMTLNKVGEGSISVVDGKNGKALQFKNAGLGIDDVKFNLGKQYTICATMRFEKGDDTVRLFGSGIFDLGAGFTVMLTKDGYWIYAGAASKKDQFINATDSSYSQTVNDPYDGLWHTIALVVDLEKGYQRFYIDGSAEAMMTWSNQNVLTTDDKTYGLCEDKYDSLINQAFGIGCGGISKNSYTGFGDMYFQDFAIYNKAFTINDFRNMLEMNPVEGGNSNDPEAPVIIDFSNLPKTIPNNYSMDGISDAIYNAVTTVSVKNNPILLYISIGSTIVTFLIFVVSLIVFVRRKKYDFKSS